MHKVEIEHDERFLARPYKISCGCRFQAAAENEKEAERIKAAHLAQQEFFESLLGNLGSQGGRSDG